MATITNVSLNIHSQTPSSATVSVKGTMQFTAADVGKEYYLSIVLRGSDPPGDAPPFDPIGNEVLHTFMFGDPPFQQAFKKIKVAQAGAIALTEQRPIRLSQLNEDKGQQLVVKEFGGVTVTVPVPWPDEVYALVKLAPGPVSDTDAGVKSNIWVGSFGK